MREESNYEFFYFYVLHQTIIIKRSTRDEKHEREIEPSLSPLTVPLVQALFTGAQYIIQYTVTRIYNVEKYDS